MEVLGHLAHRGVEAPFIDTEALIGSFAQHRQQPLSDVRRYLGAMIPSDHHWHRTDLTVGHPTLAGHRIPMGESIGLAKLTVRVSGREGPLL